LWRLGLSAILLQSAKLLFNELTSEFTDRVPQDSAALGFDCRLVRKANGEYY
jgi:hypothetical protein